MTETSHEDRSIRCGEVLNRALHRGLVREEDTALLFHDLSLVEQRVRQIQSAFPPTALHAISVKANPLPALLRRLNDLGVGLEAASFPELHLALGAGVPPDRIVFDSPVKTFREISFALERGVSLNADSLEEIERIAALLRERHTPSRIGIRINPQVGAGTIGMTSTADDYSKFGVPLSESRDRLKEAFQNHPWLEGVHLHIGSQSCPMDLLVRGVESVTAFALETNRQLQSMDAPNRIRVVDIGGGLRVPYRVGETTPDVAEYSRELASRCPDLFTREFSLITEFGRYVHAHAGWAASRVEYVKRAAAGNTIMVHLGADMFLRRCYRPEDWHHHISVLDGKGRTKRGDTILYTVAGPLCFSGDIIARDIPLPATEPGDYLVVHDAGAYTLSMWSRYNSREIPRVLGYEEEGKTFTLLKEREVPRNLSDFWS
jgi:diaminopimelate decarboxylase